jgi:hypothetical protein
MRLRRLCANENEGDRVLSRIAVLELDTAAGVMRCRCAVLMRGQPVMVLRVIVIPVCVLVERRNLCRHRA